MDQFIPGQRWISSAEPDMGLGTVTAVELRTVTLTFPASGDVRSYARAAAPLTRVAFGHGDSITARDGVTLKVEAVQAVAGLLRYTARDEQGAIRHLDEGELSHFIQLNRPTERLFSGQIDADKWFELRYRSLLELNRLTHSDLRGLTGCRTSLIPHQLYIAHEVAHRYAPRVLLADEVGLGKTIEAGLILHHQLLTERARRVLILVPESLVHQWLVEMLRRFNLFFSIFDEQRCQAIEQGSPGENPFQSTQLVLCSLAFLVNEPQRFAQARAGDWDLLVVDEAHHLQWTPQQASHEYRLVESLAAQTRGVLLLTATPEQLGKAGHFARLRLLDPDRFPDFDSFVEEEAAYEPVAAVVETLLNDQPLDAAGLQTLRATIDEGDNQSLLDLVQNSGADAARRAAARRELVEHLLDRHGTGRVLFRNTRAAVKGFPGRKVSACPLPAAYAATLEALQSRVRPEPRLLLCPELFWQTVAGAGDNDWTRIDPRVDWLAELLTRLKPAKVLVITASARTALDLAAALRTRAGIHAAVFHEGLSLVERDRAAAFFADQAAGSQVLLCSEIGSEGRNFQFAHHMVLFDLPLNPDLLEQRIGRLDRIGQTQTINIHVPYLRNSAQEVLLRWYHEGLEAFEHTCPAGHSVFTQVETALLEALQRGTEDNPDVPALIATTRELHRQLNDALHRGRDRLLEYNSCRPHVAERLRERALAEDKASTLADYMDSVFDCFGVDSEEHSAGCIIIRPGAHMVAPFPGLAEDGMTVTYDRDTALAFEDAHFLTWDHPMVTAALDLLLSNETGNAAVTAVKFAGARPGTVLLECVFVLQAANATGMQGSRYLPPTALRMVVDAKGTRHDNTLTHACIRANQQTVDTDTATRVVAMKQAELREILEHCEQLARALTPDILAAARHRGEQTLQQEINRLRALRRVNRNIRDEEIVFFERTLQALIEALESVGPRLDAVRVIVTT